jgi:hypothetical protein
MIWPIALFARGLAASTPGKFGCPRLVLSWSSSVALAFAPPGAMRSRETNL